MTLNDSDNWTIEELIEQNGTSGIKLKPTQEWLTVIKVRDDCHSLFVRAVREDPTGEKLTERGSYCKHDIERKAEGGWIAWFMS